MWSKVVENKNLFLFKRYMIGVFSTLLTFFLKKYATGSSSGMQGGVAKTGLWGGRRKGLSRVNGGTRRVKSQAHIFSSIYNFELSSWVRLNMWYLNILSNYHIVCEIQRLRKFHTDYDLFLNKLIPNHNFLTFNDSRFWF